MKLQLDRSALEYLYESSGDEFKLELQSAVVQQFANRYLKALVTDGMVVSAKAQVEKTIEATASEKRDEVIEELYNKATGSLLSVSGIESRIEASIARLVEREYAKQIAEHVRKKIAEQIANPF